MATYYFTGNTNNNWGTATNWSTTSGGTGDGAVPTSTDDVIFDALSPNCTVDTTGRVCLTINFTNYTNTITMTNTITVSGNVTLGASMGISGSADLTVIETCTLTSNGKTWSAGFNISSNGKTYTLADSWTVTGTSTLRETMNGNTFNVGGNLVINSPLFGTTLIKVTGNCTWTATVSTYRIANNMTIDCGVNTLTMSGNVAYGGGVFTYTSGTVTTTGSTFNVVGANSTFACSGITFNTFRLDFTGGVYTLNENINTSNFTVFSNSTCNGSSINLTGALSLNRFCGGTTTLNINGTGSQTWSTTDAQGALYLSTTINKSAGTLTISGNVYYAVGTLTYTAGSVTTTSSTLNLGAASTTTTFNASGILWNNVAFVGGTITLNSDVNINGIYSTPTAGVTFNGTWTINVAGGLSPGAGTNQGTGNTTINLTGGTWSGSGGIYVNLNLNGTITISGTVYFNFKTLTYVSGTITTTGSTLNIPAQAGGDATLDTSGMTWNNFSTNDNITLLSNLNIGGTYSVLATTTVNGNFNINCSGGITANSTLVQGTGTTTLNLLGGTWSGNNAIRINTVINGSITVSGSVAYNTGTLTYTSGTVTTTGSTLTIGASTTLNTNGITWNNVTISSATITNNSAIRIDGVFNNGVTVLNGSDFNCYGNFTQSTSQSTRGTAVVYFKGNTTWTATAGNVLRNDLNIDAGVNTVSISGTVGYGSGTITYTSGSVSFVSSGKLDVYSTPSLTLTTNMTISGQFYLNQPNTLTINGTFNLNLNDGIRVDNTGIIQGTGTTTINLLGGIWQGGGYIRPNTVINGSITVSGSVAYNTGTLTYTSGTVTTTGSTLSIGASTTLNTNGITWDNVTASGTITITLSSNLTVSGTFVQTSGTTTINNNTIYVGGSMSLTGVTSQIRGSVNIVINGTGTLSVATNNVANTIGTSGTFEINTAGTITLGTFFRIECDTVTYTSGTITYTNALFLVRGYGRVSGTQSVNWTDTITGGGLIIQGAGTFNLVNNINCTGSILIGSSADSLTINSNTIYGSSGLTISTSGIISGTTTIELTGGTWSNSSSGALRNNLTINGNVTVSGTVYYNTGTLTYTSGTVTTTGSTLNIGASTTLNTNGMSWNNITHSGTAITITLNSPLTLNGLLNSNMTSGAVINGSPIYCNGGHTFVASGGTLSGTSNLYYQGGTITGSNTNTSKTIYINGNITFASGSTYSLITGASMIYTSGTVTTTNHTLAINGSCSLNTNGDNSTSATTISSTGINWNNLTLNGNIVVTNTGNLTIIGTYSGIGGNSDIIGGAIYCLGNISVTGTSLGQTTPASITIHGTASQTLSGPGIIRHSLNINKGGGTLSISSISYGIGTITYIAGTVTTSGTLSISSSCTLNTNGDSSASATNTSSTGINWNNIALGGSTTITNASNLTAIGGVSTSAGLTGTISGNIFYLHGSISLNGPLAVTNLVFRGASNQTWSGVGGSVSATTIDVNKSGGTLTLGTPSFGVVIGNTTLTNTSSSEIIILAPFVTLGSTNINWPGVIWPSISTDGFVTFTLNHDLLIRGSLGLRYSLTLTGVYNVYVGGSLTTYERGDIGGTATVIMNGTGLLAGRDQFQSDPNSTLHYMRIYCNLKIDTTGTITIGNNLQFNGTGRTYEYVKGNIITNLATDRQFPTHSCSLSIQGSSTFLNFDKIKFKNVSIQTTITANKMFEGTAKIPCNITGTGTINFSDRLEKISKYIKIRNITIGNRGQLLVTYANGNKGGNVGIRFRNDLPNGINQVSNTLVPIETPSYGYGTSMTSDPSMISNI